MSEGVFLLARNQNDYSLKQARTALFGLAGVSIVAKPGRVYHIAAVNNAATPYFLQIHNKATAPVAADVPVWECKLPASLDCDIDWGVAGLYLTLGFGVAISSTAGSLTLAAANDAVVYAQYTTAT